MNRAVASFVYVGLLRPAPGSWGSLAALPVAWLLYALGGPWLVLVAVPLLFAAGLHAARACTAGQADHDPSWIVVDEVVGQWIALLPVLFGAWYTGALVTALWPGWVAAFVLFRLFDILKPSLVGAADRRGDVLGLMLDDVWAGLFAALGVVLLAALAHLPVIL
ncbi:phosphatidylglycerophosphatase, putative [Oceanicola granulosus HTCC2516]|uniref:Phosphatidylglycerophosphatase A n=1 Tax=Oceanicola granulosus (strain ATCC BAA-861 / DSM 15982 / KCTC 12143 / HTCC2516) TaxID=314256 RepID=Q2CD10_OCEGH|nr:phosphatidylglycerophosphatase A [Oceanicola granulosus]EAR50566.1 phosphatidylglycerophosphatase, putative [Oceanicola granulosus HTCC2516]